MRAFVERRFRLTENGTTIRAELRGGVVTFLTMSYIVFVQPGVLAMAGMDFGAVMVATCLSAALATFVMAFGANYPVALAPCMGENFFFVAVVGGAVTGTAVPWQTALGAVFVSGLLFLLLSLFRFREAVLAAIPPGLGHAIPAGIGAFLAFLGLHEGGLVVDAPGALVRLGDVTTAPAIVCLLGLLATAVLLARGVPGALLWGLLTTTGIGLALGVVRWPSALVALPPDPTPVLGRLELGGLLDPAMLPVVAIFLFMVLFDTVGTLTGVGRQAGLVRDGRLERAGPALLSDAVGTTAGAVLGTSTVSSYIESAAGVAEGARTGLASVVTGTLFLAALFLHPLVRTVGGGVEVADGVFLHPVTAPVLILVGWTMMRNLRGIAWEDARESIPAFLVVVGMPLTSSIADGLALGFVTWPLLQALSGRARHVPALVWVLAALLVGVFVTRARAGG